MTADYELWNADKATQLIPWAVACVALLVLLVTSHLPSRVRTLFTSCRHCAAKDEEIARLLDALADARYERTARQQPLELNGWVDETGGRRSRRRHWHTRLTWPGLNTGAVPFRYGDHLDRPLDDPCLRTPAPDSDEIREWILIERLFDTLDPQPGWSVGALPPVVHPRSIFASPASKARLAMPSHDRGDHPHTDQMENASA